MEEGRKEMTLTPTERKYIVEGLYLLGDKLREEGRTDIEQQEVKFAQQVEVSDLGIKIESSNVVDNIFNG